MGKNETSAFSFNSPLNPSALPVTTPYNTAAFGAMRIPPPMPEAEELKSQSAEKAGSQEKTSRHIAVETGATLQPLKSNVKEGTMPISFQKPKMNSSALSNKQVALSNY